MTIQFKIQIRGIKKPPVWRRIVIPGTFTFHDLHDTIQAAFGWWNEHLYQFERSPFDRGWIVKELNADEDWWDDEPEDSKETNVADFIQHMGLTKFVYVYDFGDSWVHDITVENIDKEAELDHPVCIAGKGSCPPEDCGGVWGYEEMKEEMDKEEISAFSLDDVNQELEDITAGSKDEPRLRPASGFPKTIQLIDVVKRITKGELTVFATGMGFTIPKNISEKRYQEQYAKAILDNPIQVLKHLPIEDLIILENLKEHPAKGNIVDCYENYYNAIMVNYGLVSQWPDKNGDYYLQVPEDLWQAVSPHIKEVMDDPAMHSKVVVETFISGLANLYGQVSYNFLKKEMVRLGIVQTFEEAGAVLADTLSNSLLMTFTMSYVNKPTIENTVFLSRYNDNCPTKWGADEDYKPFTQEEILHAARTPIPQIVSHPAQQAFQDLLINSLGLDEWEAVEVCHDLWYYEMHKQYAGFEDNSPSYYFRNHVLAFCTCQDSLRHKALTLFDDYLNNMPHWQLKGHTPNEAHELLSEEAKAPKQAPKSRKTYATDHYFDFEGWPSAPLDATMPIIIGKKPGRNDPCPCGSGKIYKNCCGRGN